MNKKEKYLYYGIAVLLSALLAMTGILTLTERNKNAKTEIESRLPENQGKEQQQTEENPMIRVVIKTDEFRQITHSQLGFQAEHGLVMTAGSEKIETKTGEVVMIAPDDTLFQKGNIRIEAREPEDKIAVTTLKRGYGVPLYRGCLEVFTTAEGMVLVNELPMESYLYAVVPSEMPASYAKEALKVQAVCARSYAYCQMAEAAYPEYGAHVDDSTAFQVYGNSKEQESAVQAVDATKGEKLWYQNQVITAYYYSTSCGKSTSIEAWGTTLCERNQYLKGADICDENGNAYEASLPWYRWCARIPEQTLSNLIALNTAKKIGELQNVAVTRQGVGGVALQLTVQGSGGCITIDTENKIRKALGGSGYQIEKQDGTVVNSQPLLPSAFFTIEKSGGTYVIRGGGFGHGIGMSQNGANEMAKAGKTYQEILQLFYPGITIG